MKPLQSKVDLILHPIRLRIIQAFIGNRRLTPQQIAQELPDTAQATLYRHINKLARAGILMVVEERQIRGALEKVYMLRESATNLTEVDFANISRDDHLHFFTTFVATLLNDFAHYLERDTIDLHADGVGYRQVGLYLSDEEFLQMSIALNQALLPFLSYQPAPNRRRRVLTTIVMPNNDASSPPDDETPDVTA